MYVEKVEYRNNLKISRELLFRNMGMEDEIKSDE